jgi:hypothetical protein
VSLKNPNYRGPRPQPFDTIVIKTKTAPASAIADIQSSKLDAAMLDGGDPIAGVASTIASEWSPGVRDAREGSSRSIVPGRVTAFPLARRSG